MPDCNTLRGLVSVGNEKMGYGCKLERSYISACSRRHLMARVR